MFLALNSALDRDWDEGYVRASRPVEPTTRYICIKKQ